MAGTADMAKSANPDHIGGYQVRANATFSCVFVSDLHSVFSSTYGTLLFFYFPHSFHADAVKRREGHG